MPTIEQSLGIAKNKISEIGAAVGNFARANRERFTYGAAASALVLTGGCGDATEPVQPTDVPRDPAASATPFPGVEITPSQSASAKTSQAPDTQPPANLPAFEGVAVDPSCSKVNWQITVGTRGLTLEQWTKETVDQIQYHIKTGHFGQGLIKMTCSNNLVQFDFTGGNGLPVEMKSSNAA